MKKNLLMTSCSLIILFGTIQTANALTPTEQLKAVKEIFVKSFNDMDTNQDGEISKKEYLTHQFESFRINVLKADSFDATLTDSLLEGLNVENTNKTIETNNKVEKKSSSSAKETKKETQKEAKKETTSSNPSAAITSSTDIMQEMANYTLELDDTTEGLSKAEAEIEALLKEDGVGGLTQNDVMPEISADELPKLEELEIVPPEDVDVDSLIKPEVSDKDKEIEEMMSVIKKTLPKKIDEITSWVDIEYKDKKVSYIYKADVDTSTFKPEEKAMLNNSIKTEACVNAYQTMCPKIKPMFIDVGINMQIRYIDNQNQELSSCEFNETTCQL